MILGFSPQPPDALRFDLEDLEQRVLLSTFAGPTHGPLHVSSVNPRYFADATGKTIYLSGMHTWANLQDRGPSLPLATFDYSQYVDWLVQNNADFTRLWVWENVRWADWTTGDFWVDPPIYARTGPGTALDGRPKFNLGQFNQSFFDRLRQRVAEARDHGIYVSVQLFQGWSIHAVPSYPGNAWPGHPFHAANNVNGLDPDANHDGQGDEVETLGNRTVTALQEAYVRKMIDTLAGMDNVIWEIASEAPAGPAYTAWQYHFIDYVHSYEAAKPMRHPVLMSWPWPWPQSNDVLYASHAEAISPGLGGPWNNNAGDYRKDPPAADGSKVIIADTDHFWGVGGTGPWAWKSLTRGVNPVFLDPYNDGTGVIDPKWESVRKNLGYTQAYASKINLAAMTPHGELTSTAYALANPGSEYLVYQPAKGAFTVDLTGAPGLFAVEWFNPASGRFTRTGTIGGGGKLTFTPPFAGDAVLYLKWHAAALGATTGAGLRAQYYNNADFTRLKAERIDPGIDFNWGSGAPTRTMGVDHFSAAWSGSVQPLYSQTYTFYTTSDDGVRLWVNGQLLINDWAAHRPKQNQGTIALSAGRRYDIRLEYFEAVGGASMSLSWSSPSQAKQVIPARQLYPALTPATVSQVLTATDIGAPSLRGNTAELNPGRAYDMTAGGQEIELKSDQFQFAWQQRTGDFDVLARIESFTAADLWAKAGLMVRESLSATSRNVAMLATPGANGYRFQYRSATGGSTTTTGSALPPGYPNAWVRLRRLGNVFTGFSSSDGNRWTLVGSVSMALPNTIYLGLAADAHSTTKTVSVKFRDATLL